MQHRHSSTTTFLSLISSCRVAVIDDSNAPPEISVREALVVECAGRVLIRRELDHPWAALVAVEHQRLLEVLEAVVGAADVVNVRPRGDLVLAHASLGRGRNGAVGGDADAAKDALLRPLRRRLELKAALGAVRQVERMPAGAIVLVVAALHEEGVGDAPLQHHLGDEQAVDVPGNAPTLSSGDGLVASGAAHRADLRPQRAILGTANLRNVPRLDGLRLRRGRRRGRNF